MRTCRTTGLCLAVISTVSAATVAAVQRNIDLAAVGEAMTLGRTAIGTERTRFHSSYRVSGATPPIDYIDIVTPFRRVVLGAQSRAARGERALAQREALDLLAGNPDQLDVYVEMTFHPLNTFIGVPEYDLRLETAAGAAAQARAIRRVPRTGPRLDGLPPASPSLLENRVPADAAALTGGTLAAQFDLQMLDASGRYDIVVLDGKTELGRVRVNLAALQ